MKQELNGGSLQGVLTAQCHPWQDETLLPSDERTDCFSTRSRMSTFHARKCTAPTICLDMFCNFSLSIFWSKRQSHDISEQAANAVHSTAVWERCWIKVFYSMKLQSYVLWERAAGITRQWTGLRIEQAGSSHHASHLFVFWTCPSGVRHRPSWQKASTVTSLHRSKYLSQMRPWPFVSTLFPIHYSITIISCISAGACSLNSRQLL
jgi:hypothetical protein